MNTEIFDIRHAAAAAVHATGGSTCRIEAAMRATAGTESPIEAIFSAWFVSARDNLLAKGNTRFLLALQPQAWVMCPELRRYRLDFALVPLDGWLTTALSEADLTLK